ncbi:GNAT family N-acetyltransferase [bacterium]|nr:GNAT family N-acetyltransferase [bacterium]
MAEPNTTITIREFDGSDADYAAQVRISNALWPDRQTCVENIKHRDRTRERKYLYSRVMAEEDGRVVAVADYGESTWSHVPGKYVFFISVHPEHGNRGIGTALYEFIMRELEGADTPPSYFATWVREDQEIALHFVESRGFGEIMRDASSSLELGEFDANRFEDAARAVREGGIAIDRLDRLMERFPDAMRRLYDLDWEAMQDMPNDDPPVRRSFDAYCAIMQPPRFDPKLGYVALDGSAWVGASLLWYNPAETDVLGTEITSVLRSHRRRGIATALKVATLADARECGFRKVWTENADTNPMYGINLRLGFKSEPSWIDFRRYLHRTNGKRARECVDASQIVDASRNAETSR